MKDLTEAIKNGTILTAYGKKFLLSVTLVPNISKVRFSLVEIGTKGGNHNDFYMDYSQMRRLCEEIGNGVTAKKITADATNQYPGAYKYVTGENGSKKLNIGGGQIGCRVQIQINKDGNWDNKISAVSYDDLREMAFLFNLCSGLVPVLEKSFYGNLYKAFLDGEETRNKFHSSYNPKEDDEVTENASAEEETPDKSQTAQEIFTEPDKPTKIVPESSVPTVSSTPVTSYRMKISVPLTPMGTAKKALKGVTEDNRELPVVFENILLNGFNSNDFVTKAERVGSIITFKGFEKDNRVYATAI